MKLSKVLLMIALISLASEASFAQVGKGKAKGKTPTERAREIRKERTGMTEAQSAAASESGARKTQIENRLKEAQIEVANNASGFSATILERISQSKEKTDFALELIKDKSLDRNTVLGTLRLISLDKSRSMEINVAQYKKVLSEYKSSEKATAEFNKIINGAALIVDKGQLPSQLTALFEVTNGRVSVKLLEGLTVDAKVKEVLTGELNTKRAMMLSFLALKIKEGKTMEEALSILKQLIEKGCFG